MIMFFSWSHVIHEDIITGDSNDNKIMMNYHGDTHQKASIYVKCQNDLNDDWMYRVTNLTRNTPALCAGNLGGNIHQTSLLTTASSPSLRLFTWSQISRGMSRHFCRSTWSHTCQHIALWSLEQHATRTFYCLMTSFLSWSWWWRWWWLGRRW